MADFTKLFKAIEDAVTCQRKAPNMACSICTLSLRTEYELLVGENWEHKEELLGAAAPSLPSQPKPITFNRGQAKTLLEMFGNEDGELTVVRDGDGLLAYDAEYPEEGSIEL